MSSVEDVTVVFSTRNRAPTLRAVLQRLEATRTEGFAWRIVVADNGSSDETPAVLREAGGRLPLEWLRVEQPGKNRALNAALPRVRGRLVVFTDDDVLVSPGWLEALRAAAVRWPDRTVFGGRVLLASPPGTPDWRVQVDPEYFDSFARYDLGEDELLTDRAPHGPCFAVRGEIFESMSFSDTVGPDGTSDYAQGSEYEFISRVMRVRGEAVYVPDAIVHHIVTPTQLEEPRLIARARAVGRGLVRRDPTVRTVRLLGAPRWLWRRVAEDALLCLRPGRSPRERLRDRVRLACRRGMLHEHRRLPRE